jgi:hypothetical protein
MQIANITFFAHQLKRKYQWQTASYSADAVQVFYIKLEADNGLTGIGGSSVMPRDNSTFGPGIDALQSAIQESITGRDLLERDSIMAHLDRQLPRYTRRALDGLIDTSRICLAELFSFGATLAPEGGPQTHPRRQNALDGCYHID